VGLEKQENDLIIDQGAGFVMTSIDRLANWA